jgi:hypothetical protein
MSEQQQKQNNSRSDLMKYAGLGMQIFVSLGLAVFAGFRLDKWINMQFPVFVWVLPLIVLFLMIFKLIRETSKRSGDDKE